MWMLFVVFSWLMWSIAKAGTQVIVPYREEDEKRHLKVTGDLGQVVPLVSNLFIARPKAGA